MLEKFLNKKVLICISQYAAAITGIGGPNAVQRKGVVTNIDDKFIELDNDEIIAIQYITTIKSL